MKDALVIRIFDQVEGEEGLNDDREYEVMGMQVAHKIGVAQPVYAIFNNGVVYKYATGRTLTSKDVKNPTIIK